MDTQETSACRRPSTTLLHHIWAWLVYVANTVVFLLSGVIVCRALFVLPSGVGSGRDFGYLALLYLIL